MRQYLLPPRLRGSIWANERETTASSYFNVFLEDRHIRIAIKHCKGRSSKADPCSHTHKVAACYSMQPPYILEQ